HGSACTAGDRRPPVVESNGPYWRRSCPDRPFTSGPFFAPCFTGFAFCFFLGLARYPRPPVRDPLSPPKEGACLAAAGWGPDDLGRPTLRCGTDEHLVVRPGYLLLAGTFLLVGQIPPS